MTRGGRLPARLWPAWELRMHGIDDPLDLVCLFRDGCAAGNILELPLDCSSRAACASQRDRLEWRNVGVSEGMADEPGEIAEWIALVAGVCDANGVVSCVAVDAIEELLRGPAAFNQPEADDEAANVAHVLATAVEPGEAAYELSGELLNCQRSRSQGLRRPCTFRPGWPPRSGGLSRAR